MSEAFDESCLRISLEQKDIGTIKGTVSEGVLAYFPEQSMPDVFVLYASIHMVSEGLRPGAELVWCVSRVALNGEIIAEGDTFYELDASYPGVA